MEKEAKEAIKKVKKVLVKHLPPVPGVFGKAPSLESMRNRPGFRGAVFWFYYRSYLPYAYPALFLVFLILSLTIFDDDINGSLILGSILSVTLSLSVIFSYIMILPWRKHPSILIINRTVASFLFSLNIFWAATQGYSSCSFFAVFIHFCILSSECWQTTIALDLVHSVTNPFISYKSTLKLSQIYVFSFTFLICFIFYNDTSCQADYGHGICWVKFTNGRSPCLWGYFLFWVVCMYAYQFYACLYSYYRLKKGLPATFAVRQQVAMETFKCLSIYSVYLLLLIICFGIIGNNPNFSEAMEKFGLFFLFLLANKGSVDGIVWFMLHDFSRSGSTVKLKEEKDEEKTEEQAIKSKIDLELGGFEDEQNEEDESEDEDEFYDPVNPVYTNPNLRNRKKKKTNILEVGDLTKNLKNTVQELADMTITDIDETDLSPQVNLALRQQIVQYVTTGVKTSITKKNMKVKSPDDISVILDKYLKKPDMAHLKDMEVLQFYIEDDIPFKSFAPSLFQKLRQNEGIDDKKFLSILSQSANERLSEGQSGAFMFFCGGGEYIVKTIRGREAKVLHESLPRYASHLERNRDSMLCRFLGSYSIEIFSQTFYFVVMLNCFDPKAYINERFDIKGSWVGRSAEPAKSDKRCVCRHCNEYFFPYKKEKCTTIIGEHEASVVLKDNDLRSKISLDKDNSKRVVDILMKDSNLLGELGVIDYSLLIGVKKWKFGVEVDDDILHYDPIKKITNYEENISFSKRAITFKAGTVSGPAVYHFGVIDFLQNWTYGKIFERNFKIYIMHKDGDGLSVMEPENYKLRFQRKLLEVFDIDPSDYEPEWHSLFANKAGEALTSPILTTIQPLPSSADQDFINNSSTHSQKYNNVPSAPPSVPSSPPSNHQIHSIPPSNPFSSITSETINTTDTTKNTNNTNTFIPPPVNIETAQPAAPPKKNKNNKKKNKKQDSESLTKEEDDYDLI